MSLSFRIQWSVEDRISTFVRDEIDQERRTAESLLIFLLLNEHRKEYFVHQLVVERKKSDVASIYNDHILMYTFETTHTLHSIRNVLW